jgi:thymidylate synthase ThyX
MQASALPESRTLAQQMIVQVTKILPTLLRHSEPSPYQLRLDGQVTSRGQLGDTYSAGPEVELISYTGKGAANPEVAALQLLSAVLTGNDEATGDEHLLSLVEGLGGHDTLPELFSWIRYDCRMVMSEAAWHQLLRHTRGMSFQWGPPEIGNGYTVPPSVVAAGLQDKVSRAVMQAEKMYKDIYNEAPELAGYAVTNAHRRRIRSEFDLRQLYHLVNLRVSEHAQWDIKDAIRQLWHQVQQVHPRLGAQASRRS